VRQLEKRLKNKEKEVIRGTANSMRPEAMRRVGVVVGLQARIRAACFPGERLVSAWTKKDLM
jgi:hypothetical protein